PFGVRWDAKEKLWYFPGDVLPKELERFRPPNAPNGPVEKIILDIPFSYRDIAAKAGARWDSEIKAYFFSVTSEVTRQSSSLTSSKESRCTKGKPATAETMYPGAKSTMICD